MLETSIVAKKKNHFNFFKFSLILHESKVFVFLIIPQTFLKIENGIISMTTNVNANYTFECEIIIDGCRIILSFVALSPLLLTRVRKIWLLFIIHY